MKNQFNLNKTSEAIVGLSNKLSRERPMTSQEIIEVGAFNNGCDLTLSNIENYIVELEQAGEPVEVKYARVLRMVVGMRAVIEKRITPQEEPPAVIMPESKIIIAS